MSLSFKYKLMQCEPADYKVPNGYELVPINSKEDDGMYYSAMGFGSDNINQWLYMQMNNYSPRIITSDWCPVIRKRKIIDDKKPFAVRFQIIK